MRTEIDTANIEPEELATQIARWLEVLERRGKPTPEMDEARVAARNALQSAVDLNRQSLVQSIAEQCGTAAMEFAAREGLAEVVRQLAAEKVDVNTSLRRITPLIFAARKGHTATVEALLDCGADPRVSEMGIHALGEAISENHREIADLLLARCSDLANMEYMRGTLLHLVARKNRSEYVEILVSHGVSPDQPDNLYITPLVVAAEQGSGEVAEELLKAGASTELPLPDPDTKERDLWFRLKDTALIHAAKHGHEGIAKMLIAAGALVDTQGQQEMTALDWAKQNGHRQIEMLLRAALGLPADALDAMDLVQAAKSGDLETIRRAIAAGVEIDFRDKPHQGKYYTIGGRTALMHASIEGHVEAARMLIEAGASLTIKEDCGGEATAFEIAAGHDRPEILAFMLENGEPVDEKLLARATVEAARSGSFNSVKYLLDAGVKVNARGSYRYTPLIAAAGSGRAEVVRLLLERGAKVDLKTSGDFAGTALHEAIGNLGPSHGDVDEQGNQILLWTGDAPATIHLLVAAGADVNLERKDGDFPLEMAVRYPEIVQLLLEAGADPHKAHRCSHETALWTAVLWENIEAAKLLLEAGADPCAVNCEGKSPLDVAVKDKKTELVNLLQEYGALPGKEIAAGRTAQAAVAEKEEREQQRWQAAAEADERLRPDFTEAAKRDNFLKAVANLEDICGTSAEYEDHLPGIAYCKLPFAKAKELWYRENTAFQRLECYLFRCGRAFLADDDELLAILPTSDQFEVVAAMGTNGVNYGKLMSDVVAGLHKIHEMAPFRISKVAHDTVEAIFDTPPNDPKELAKVLYEFCPDIVDQGVGTVRKLEKSLKDGRDLFLWWD